MDPLAPCLTSAQVARLLGIDRRQFHALRAAGHASRRIEPSSGGRPQGTLLWSAFDGIRFAVLSRLAPARKRAELQLPLARRREVFEALEDRALEEAVRGRPCWLVVPAPPSTGAARVVAGPSPELGTAIVAMVVDVAALAGRALLRIQLIAADEEEAGRGGRI